MNRREFTKTGLLLAAAAAVGRYRLAAAPTSSLTVDTHAHIFQRGLPLALKPRYVPDYDAPLKDYLAQLDQHHITKGVLVQPSFLGTDNSYLTAALMKQRDRLRGVGVIPPTATADTIAELAGQGIVGIRLNLIGQKLPELKTPVWQGFLSRVQAAGWSVDIQVEAHDLPVVVDGLLASGVKVVVDHFGRPDPTKGIEDPGFRYLLEKGPTGQIWVKLSGAYRNGPKGVGEKIALAASPLLLQSFGPRRLVWGSDWPHTQFEKVASYDAAWASLQQWVPDDRQRATILWDTPVELYHFSSVAAAS